MVGALVRGWRNRSAPRRAGAKLATPQSQDGTRNLGMCVTLDRAFFLRLQEGDCVSQLDSPAFSNRMGRPGFLALLLLIITYSVVWGWGEAGGGTFSLPPAKAQGPSAVDIL